MAGTLISPYSRSPLVVTLTYRESLQKNDPDAAPLGEIDYLLIVAGNSDEENPYRKGSAVQVRFSRLSYHRLSLTTVRKDRPISSVTNSRAL